MSAFGRGIAPEIIEAIRAVMREFVDFGRAVREAGRLTDEQTRRERASERSLAKARRHFEVSAGDAVGEHLAWGGGDGMDYMSSALDIGMRSGVKALKAIPFVGEAVSAAGESLVSNMTAPYNNAADRTAGVTTMLARAGVPEAELEKVRKNLNDLFLPQEKAAAKEALAVRALAREEMVEGGLGWFVKAMEALAGRFEAMAATQMGGTSGGGGMFR